MIYNAHTHAHEYKKNARPVLGLVPPSRLREQHVLGASKGGPREREVLESIPRTDFVFVIVVGRQVGRQAGKQADKQAGRQAGGQALTDGRTD